MVPVKKTQELSFSLIETIIALGILATMIVQVAAIQGNSIYFSEYGRNLSVASWLAKRVMSQVEYYEHTKDFKELNTEIVGATFKDFPEYKYDLIIKDWKLDIIGLLTGNALNASSEEDKEEKSEDDQMAEMMKTVLKQVLGDEILKVAEVKVSWAEGAKRNDVSLTYLLTNQKKVDEVIGGLSAMQPGAGLKKTYKKRK